MVRKKQCLALVALVAFLVPIGPAVGADEVRFDVHKRVRVDVKTQAQFQALDAVGGIIENDIPGVGRMNVVVTPGQLDEIRQLGLSVIVLTENVQELIDRQKLAPVRGDPFNDFFLDYHSYGSVLEAGTIVWYLNELATAYPTLASMVAVGNTLEGRTIWGVRIANDAVADKPAVVYFGCEHAREWITTTVPPYVATHLLENYGSDPLVTDLVDNVEFFLIPVFNVDGYEYSRTTDRMWRKNRRDNGGGIYGVDLNRNWAEGWGGPGSSSDPSSQIYRGTAPFSEPETQVMRDFFIARSNVRAQLDIHSYTQLILWPYGYTPTLPADQYVYQDVGSTMKSLIYAVHGMSYSIGPIYTTIYAASGGSLDWTYAQRDILSYSFECRDMGEYGFLLPPEQIIPNNEELLPAILHLTDSDWVRLPLRFEFPDGLPSTITAGTDTTIAVNIVSQSEPVAPETASMFYRYDATGSFAEASLTWMTGDSYEAVLPATNCTSAPQFYFSVESDAGSAVTDPRDAPTDMHTAGVGTGTASFFLETLSTDPGWTTEGQWAWGQPTGGGGEYGGPDPTGGYTGPNVYGYNLSGDYPNNLPEQHLTTGPLDCTGRSGVHLAFWRWLGVEQPAWDHAYVRVSSNGTDWTTVWENEAQVADTSWVYQDLDISAVADDQPDVYLRWTMGTTDTAWRFCGWNIDDIGLSAAVCEGIAGDFNGDGNVDSDDYDQFVACFTGPGGPVPPNCGFFDFDSDQDVDCIDWDDFSLAWTGPGDLPDFAQCSTASSPLPDAVAKNRYISFVPNNGNRTVAFNVILTASEYFPGAVMTGWVGEPDVDGLANISDTAVYRQWTEGMVHVGDCRIVPVATYEIRATLDGIVFSGPTTISTAARPGPKWWGDVVGVNTGTEWTSPNGIVTMTDVQASVLTYEESPNAAPLTWVDISGEVPDGLTNMADVQMTVLAFEGAEYPFSDPQACP